MNGRRVWTDRDDAVSLAVARHEKAGVPLELELLAHVAADPAKGHGAAKRAGVTGESFAGDDTGRVWGAIDFLASGKMLSGEDVAADRDALHLMIKRRLGDLWRDDEPAFTTGCLWSDAKLLERILCRTEYDERATIAAAAAVIKLRKATKPGAALLRLADVAPQSIRWLWPAKIALGKLTILAGDPGLGKSTLTCEITGIVSSGRAWPDCPALPTEPGDVLLVNCEDDVADTIRKRCDNACADVDRVHVLEGRRVLDAEGNAKLVPFDLSDVPTLESAAEQLPGLKLIVVDPVSAYLANTDSHNNAEVRGLLAPLVALAARRNVAIVLVTHLSKGGGGSALYRAMGSLAFVAAARAAFAVVRDKSDPELRLFLPMKNNLANDRAGLAYRLTDTGIQWQAGTVDIDVNEAMGVNADAIQDDPIDEAVEWLRGEMFNGPVAAKDIESRADRDGIRPRTLARAKKKLGIESGREGGTGAKGRWMWFYQDQRANHATNPATHTHVAPLDVSPDDF